MSVGQPEATLTTHDPVLLGFAEKVGAEDPVSVRGGQTRWQLGGEPTPGTRLLDAPTGIVSYAPEEMTVKVRAGTSVAELAMALAERGQRCALPDRGGTVGGALVVGENDPRANGRGRVRDALLQVRYVSAEGRMVTGGGPTVKNVTGFDIPRLMIGSLGTLGLVVEVILRTNPRPTISRWLSATDADPALVLERLLTPAAVLWNGTTTWVLLEGHLPDVDAETAALTVAGSFVKCDGPPGLPEHRWSLPPADLLRMKDHTPGGFVTVLGLGLAFADEPQPPRPLAPPIAEIAARLKANFDPTGRLNPGRTPGA